MTSLALEPNHAEILQGFLSSGWAVPWKKALSREGARPAESGSGTAKAPALLNPHWPLRFNVAVKGAASGIGLAVATRFAAEGAAEADC